MTDNSDKLPILLSEVQAANLLGVKQRTLQQWRHRKCGPKYIKVGERMVRYRISDLNSWLSEKV